jgi:MFS superfamily sulfate permease-like transporter
VTASPTPVVAVVVDLSATTDLDVPGADALGELHEQLHERGIRLMLTHVIASVGETLDRAGHVEDLHVGDVFVGPVEAVLDHLTQHGDAGAINGLLQGAEASASRIRATPTATASDTLPGS